jgi:mono/diheme cytochrome c family protein
MSRRFPLTACVGWGLLCAAVLLAAGCTQDMKDQARKEPLEASGFYRDGASARSLPEGTVARGQLREDDALYRGLGPDGRFVTEIPVTVDAALLARGQERFGIFCTPCHGRTGDGLGMVVRRGFPRAASYHEARLRGERAGYFFDVITNGFGKMPTYASQIPVRDRWAIVAYVRALQLSRHADFGRLDAADQQNVEEGASLLEEQEAVPTGGHH